MGDAVATFSGLTAAILRPRRPTFFGASSTVAVAAVSAAAVFLAGVAFSRLRPPPRVGLGVVAAATDDGIAGDVTTCSWLSLSAAFLPRLRFGVATVGGAATAARGALGFFTDLGVAIATAFRRRDVLATGVAVLGVAGGGCVTTAAAAVVTLALPRGRAGVTGCG